MIKVGGRYNRVASHSLTLSSIFELRFRLLIVCVLFIYRMTRGPFILVAYPLRILRNLAGLTQ